MNQMFKPAGPEPPLPPGDYAVEAYTRGRQQWDERIGDAVAQARRWRRLSFCLIPVIGLSAMGNVIQGAQSKTQVVHVLHDGVGSVINVSVAGDPAGEPSQAQIAAALREWIGKVRGVYSDAGILKQNILDAYKVVSTGSAANTMMDKFYQDKDPFIRARSELDYVTNVSALAPSGSAGSHGEHTWLLRWDEELRGRDGSLSGMQHWQASVTWFWAAPQNVPEAIANPDGIHITSFSWTLL